MIKNYCPKQEGGGPAISGGGSLHYQRRFGGILRFMIFALHVLDDSWLNSENTNFKAAGLRAVGKQIYFFTFLNVFMSIIYIVFI